MIFSVSLMRQIRIGGISVFGNAFFYKISVKKGGTTIYSSLAYLEKPGIFSLLEIIII